MPCISILLSCADSLTYVQTKNGMVSIQMASHGDDFLRIKSLKNEHDHVDAVVKWYLTL